MCRHRGIARKGILRLCAESARRLVPLYCVFSIILVAGCTNPIQAPEAEKVATPVLSPGSGAVACGASIGMTCATEGYVIRYTSDGSEPSSASTIYRDDARPIVLADNTTIRARAYKSGLSDSDVGAGVYTLASGFGLEVVSGGPYVIAIGEALTLCASSNGEVTYDWDLNGDGVWGDASGEAPSLAWRRFSRCCRLRDSIQPIPRRETRASRFRSRWRNNRGGRGRARRD